MSIGVTPVEYSWRTGYHAKVDAKTAAAELARLAARDQEVVPITLVEESRDPNAPLHAAFTWDDNEAAELWREDEAKRLIRSIHITYVRNDTEEPLPPQRAYISVIDEPDWEMYAPNGTPSFTTPRHYRPIAKVMSEADLREQHIRTAFAALVSWRERYRDIEQFASIFERIDALKEEGL